MNNLQCLSSVLAVILLVYTRINDCYNRVVLYIIPMYLRINVQQCFNVHTLNDWIEE